MLRIGICDDDEQFTIQLERHVLEYAKKKGVTVETQTFLNSDKLFSSIDEDGLFDLLIRTVSGDYQCKSEDIREIAFYKTGVTL